MTTPQSLRLTLLAGLVSVLLTPTSLLVAQNTTQPPVEPTPPPSPVAGIRNKISAGDLLSAESILEVHRAANGEDGQWLRGLSWLARGALLVGDTAKAEQYAAQVRANCAARMARGAELDKDPDVEIAHGAAVEVKAQLLELAKGQDHSAEYIQSELTLVKSPVSLVSRLYKRLNVLTLADKPAPELEIEDFIGAVPPTLAALKGKPVILFIWAEWCGDCKAQAAGLANVMTRYRDSLQVLALTRYYKEEQDRGREKGKIDSVWTAVYSGLGRIPLVISTASMERYGGSSTPTLVFIDRSGIVRRYTPTRLTEAELDHTLAGLLQ